MRPGLLKSNLSFLVSAPLWVFQLISFCALGFLNAHWCASASVQLHIT